MTAPHSLLLIAGLSGPLIAAAQALPRPDESHRKELSVAYFNRYFVNPGARIGYTFVLRQRAPDEQAGWALVLKNHLGFYNQPRYQTGTFVQAQIGFRRTTASGFYFEPPQVGVGVLYAFLNAPTYSVDANGVVKRQHLAGNLTAMLPYVSALGLGYRFRHTPVRAFLSVDGFLQYPVNRQFITHVSIPVGLSLQL